MRDQRAYLVRITTRQALNRLRTMKRRKEAYVGPWLPEPLLTAPDVAEDVELAESVSMALMLVLETCRRPSAPSSCCARSSTSATTRSRPPSTRAPPPSARSRTAPASTSTPAARARWSPRRETRAALESFQRALETGDLQGLLDVLAPEVVLVADGGGVKQAALRPIIGADKVRPLPRRRARQDRPARSPPSPPWSTATRRWSSASDGEIDGVMAVRVEDGRITGLYYVRNPEKLSRVEAETPLSRGAARSGR